MQVTTGTLISA